VRQQTVFNTLHEVFALIWVSRFVFDTPKPNLNIQFLTQGSQHICITKIMCIVAFKEIIAVCFENRTKSVSIGQQSYRWEGPYI
jgi:hypothetical protein